MFGIISVANSFVPIFFGSGYDKVAPLLCIISPIIVLIGLSNVTGTQYLLPTKKQNKYTLSVIIGALTNFILNLILIPKFASFGASIATVIAELAVTTTQFILIRKDIKIMDVVDISSKYIICSIIMFICSMIIGILISSNLISVIVQVISSVIIYFGLLFIVRDEIVLEGINIVKSKLLKK
jgi:O-antigen/teichoic acid export membrane protein